MKRVIAALVLLFSSIGFAQSVEPDLRAHARDLGGFVIGPAFSVETFCISGMPISRVKPRPIGFVACSMTAVCHRPGRST